MSAEINEGDITALRRDGDLGQYMRSLIRKPGTTPPARGDPTHDSRHRSGAWPHGTHPANSAICRPDCGCAPPPAA